MCDNKHCKKPLGDSIHGRRRITNQTRAGGRDWMALGLCDMVICPSCYNRVIATGKIHLKRHLASASSSSTQNAGVRQKEVGFVHWVLCPVWRKRPFMAW